MKASYCNLLLPELLQATRQKDTYAGRTTAGIHRDELEINLGKQLFRISLRKASERVYCLP